MSTLTFVNIHGATVSVAPFKQVARPRSAGPEQFHKGWRVIGIPPGAFESAKADRQREIADMLRWNERYPANAKKVPAELTYEAFCTVFKGKPVRNKPYEVIDAARVCKELAERAGWDRVELVEIKREKAVA